MTIYLCFFMFYHTKRREIGSGYFFVLYVYKHKDTPFLWDLTKYYWDRLEASYRLVLIL
jgi:hypothetical protein